VSTAEIAAGHGLSRPVKITVAIPFYSGVDRLAVALRSLMAQESNDWDGFVVDDAGPSPEARDVVADIGGGRIRYVRNERNLGLAGNWNRCLELAEQDLVTIFHADDELRPEYVVGVLDAHAAFPDAVAVYTGAQVIGSAGTPVFSFPDEVKRFTRPRAHGGYIRVAGERGLASLLRGQHIFCPSLSYKRSRLPIPAFSARWRQVTDLDLLARILLEGGLLVGVPTPSYRYRRHESSQTALLTASLDRFHEEFSVYDEIAQEARVRGWDRAARTARRAAIVRLHLLYRALEGVIGRDRAMYRSCMGLLRERRSGHGGPV
jgi:glycosyltransferase involved in cell wall biosynthesis